MADIQNAIAKLKVLGINQVPNPATIASMPGFSQEEKALLINAINTGQMQSLLNQSGVAPSTMSSQVPQQAVQKRDQPTPVDDVPSGLFGGKQPEHPINIPTQAEEDAAAAAYQERLNQVLPNRGKGGFGPATPLMPGNIGTDVVMIPPPFVPQGQQVGGQTKYLEPRQAYTNFPDPAQNPGASNRPGGSTYNSQVPQAAGGGPKFQYTPQTTASTGPSLTDILNGGGAAGSLDLEMPDIYKPGAAPTAPDYSSVRTPTGIDFTFKRNPFTKEGKEMAADVYAPQYETLDRLRTSANNQYSRSNKIIGELYKGLADDVLAAKTKRDAEYETDIAGTTAAGQTAAEQIGRSFDSGNKVLADVMAGLGDRTSKIDPTQLAENQTARGNAMGDATVAAQNAANSLKTSKETQGDYTKNLGQAYATQGAVSQENLIGELNNVLGEYGNRELDINSQERGSALSLAQMLSDWDWNSQTANYGVLQDQQQNAWNQANWDRQGLSDAYNNQWQQYTAGEEGRRFASQQEWDAYQQALKNRTDLEIAQGKAAGAGATPLDPNDYGGGTASMDIALRNWVQSNPNSKLNAQDIEDALSTAAGSFNKDYIGMNDGLNQYKNNLSAQWDWVPYEKRQLLMRAADMYWDWMRQSGQISAPK